MSQPCIPLDGSRSIDISFDDLAEDYTQYAYNIVHCNSDWTPSSITQMEYMNGFQGLPVENYDNAIGTTTSYIHYHFSLPNDDVQFKLSGNYAVQIYKEEAPDEILLTACFSVVEELVGITGEINGNTDIDTHMNHQQINFTINTRDLKIPYPKTDLKIRISQNNRLDNIVDKMSPMRIQGKEIGYEHNRELIFPAGNEYRRLEFLSNRYNGMHIEKINFHNPYYNVTVKTDEQRNKSPYHYDQDQNGRIFINCSDSNDPHTEADYFILHFRLECDPLPEGSVYINSEAFNYILDERSKMGYNFDHHCYEKAVLMKQGHYNYQYLYIPKNGTKGMTAPLEGDFYQTQNEYSIYVYYRPSGARYDRLIGMSVLKNNLIYED